MPKLFKENGLTNMCVEDRKDPNSPQLHFMYWHFQSCTLCWY